MNIHFRGELNVLISDLFIYLFDGNNLKKMTFPISNKTFSKINFRYWFNLYSPEDDFH